MISDYYILTPVNFFLENWLYLQSIHRKGHKFAYETDKYWASSLYLPFLLSLALYILPVYLCFIWTWPVSPSIPLHTHLKFQFLLLSLVLFTTPYVS
jgi:hypothetical protein